MSDFSRIPPLNAAALLKRHGLRADKRLGQNFLQDASALEKIVRAAEIQPDDWVLEIGAGLGSLTRYLAHSAEEVVAVELDPDLIGPLRTIIGTHRNVRVLQGDILKLGISELIDRPDYLVVANIPYNITSAVIRHLLEDKPRPRQVVLTVQSEVADRICALAGAMSLLALSVQVYGSPKVMAHISAESFFPTPKVDSSVLRIDIYAEPLVSRQWLPRFFTLIKAGFSQKRKTLRNSLSAGLHIAPVEAETLLTHARIDPKRRAETLSIEEWKTLCETGEEK